MRLQLSLNERVKIVNTNSFLDEMTGTNLGTSVDNVIKIYIILLDNPLDSHKAVTIPDSCLEKI